MGETEKSTGERGKGEEMGKGERDREEKWGGGETKSRISNTEIEGSAQRDHGKKTDTHEEDMFSEELPSQGAPMLPPKGLKTTGGPDCGKGFSSD